MPADDRVPVAAQILGQVPLRLYRRLARHQDLVRVKPIQQADKRVSLFCNNGLRRWQRCLRMSHMVERIVSSGQTGAERAALDFAIEHNIPHGGWCASGRRAEDGVIPSRYSLDEPRRRDAVAVRYHQEWPPRDRPGCSTLELGENDAPEKYYHAGSCNVRDSHATIIFTIKGALTEKTNRAAGFAAKYEKPWIHLAKYSTDDQAKLLRDFLANRKIKITVVNITGSKASEEPEIVAFVHEVLSQVLLAGPADASSHGRATLSKLRKYSEQGSIKFPRAVRTGASSRIRQVHPNGS